MKLFNKNKTSQFDGVNTKFNDLANKLRNGEKNAGNEIYEYFSPKFFRFFLTRTLQREAAEDLTQETFLKIVDNIDSFDEKKGNFSSWIWQIAKNNAKDYYRKKGRGEITVAEFIGKYDISENNSLSLNDKLDAEKIINSVKDLSEEEQTIFSLHYLSDLPYKEISEITNKPEGNLRVIIHRINEKIKSKHLYA